MKNRIIEQFFSQNGGGKSFLLKFLFFSFLMLGFFSCGKEALVPEISQPDTRVVTNRDVDCECVFEVTSVEGVPSSEVTWNVHALLGNGKKSLAAAQGNNVPNTANPFPNIGNNTFQITLANFVTGGDIPVPEDLAIGYTVTCTESGIGGAGNEVITGTNTYTGVLSWSDAVSTFYDDESGVWFIDFEEEYFSCYEQTVDDCLNC